MFAGLQLTQKTTQTLVMTQQMEQSIRILEMDMEQLREYVQEVALENPAIDMDAVTREQSHEALRRKKAEWLEQLSRNDRQNIAYYEHSENILEKTVAAPQTETLHEHLYEQVLLLRDQALRGAVRVLIGYLDDDGYLRTPRAELIEACGGNQALFDDAWRTLRLLDPPGVGATDLSDCLQLQLPEHDTLARAIAADCLTLLAGGKHDRIAKELGAGVDAVEEAVARIRALNPRPGSAFEGQDRPVYITPDVMVTNFQDHFYVLPCDFSYPEIRLSANYAVLMQEGDREVQAYMEQKTRQAMWIRRCIQSRGETLLRVARAIVQNQERFFRYGPQCLGVLRMSDIAAQLDLHESTVSRAVRNKYLQCSHGTFPMRYFFIQGPGRPELGQNISAEAIRHQIRALIEQETKPLSDQKIAALLSEQGTPISRRTVAKYRDQLGIPNSGLRCQG